MTDDNSNDSQIGEGGVWADGSDHQEGSALTGDSILTATLNNLKGRGDDIGYAMQHANKTNLRLVVNYAIFKVGFVRLIDAVLEASRTGIRVEQNAEDISPESGRGFFYIYMADGRPYHRKYAWDVYAYSRAAELAGLHVFASIY